MNSKTLSYIGIGFILWQLFKGAGSAIAARFEIGVPRIKIGALTFSGLRAQLYLPIINSSPVSVPIDSFQGSLLYGQHTMANLFLDRPIQVSSNGRSELEFNVFIDFSQLGTNIISLVESGQWLNSLRVKGHITSAGVVVPVDQTIQVI